MRLTAVSQERFHSSLGVVSVKGKAQCLVQLHLWPCGSSLGYGTKTSRAVCMSAGLQELIHTMTTWSQDDLDHCDKKAANV